MGDPKRTVAPSLLDVTIELTSAMSALNMPDPEHCSPKMVKHAYAHLQAATEMLVELTPFYERAIETAASSRPSVFEDAYLRLRQQHLVGADRHGRVHLRHIPQEVRDWIRDHHIHDLARVSGDVVCEQCKKPYRDHPEIHPTFVLLCDGRVGKT